MASGLVVVGPDRGGTAELLDEAQSPFVFRAGDAADLLRRVRMVLSTDLVRHAAAAQAVARRYGSWDEAIGRLIAYYEDSLQETSAAPRLRRRARVDRAAAAAAVRPQAGTADRHKLVGR